MKINKPSLLPLNFPLIEFRENVNNDLATDLIIDLDSLTPLINTKTY
jgi:hypothetical protein